MTERPTTPSSSSTPEKIIMSTKSPPDAASAAPPIVSSSTTGPAPAVGKFLSLKKAVSLSGIGVTFTRAHRASMSVRDKRCIYENATSALEPKKFAMIDISSDLTSDDFLQKNHDFIMQLARLQNRITAYCMGDVFQIIATKGFQGDWEPIGTTTTDLFKNYQTLTFDQVTESNRGYLYWSSDDVSEGENLMWSQELILNSVDDDLYDRINSKILNLLEDARGGPIALYFLADLTVLLVS
jgi:hypothetical protein